MGGNDPVSKAVDSAANFVGNVVTGVVRNTGHIIHGAVSGNWNEFRDGVIGNVQTAVAVAACAFGGPWGCAAAVVMLDAQYNKGEVTGNIVKTAGGIEHDVFGTDNINDNAAAIQATITVAASIYGGIVGGAGLMKLAGLSADTISIIKNIANIKAAYDGYEAIESIQAMKDYWEAQLAEYSKQIQEMLSQASAASEQWFSMMTDTDTRQRVMAGGDLYNGGAGSYYYIPSRPHEPAKYLLTMPFGSDTDMDAVITGRSSNDMAGGQSYLYNIDGGIKWA